MKNGVENIIWGIIGCGDVAEIKSGPAFQKSDYSELRAVMRRNGEKAKDFASRHQVPFWYDNEETMLHNDDINAVYVATPPSTHLEYAIKALQAGKHVYLEKPMVLNMHEALLLKEAVRKSNNKLVVAHYRRHLPMYLEVKDLISKGTIGDVRYVDITFLNKSNTEVEHNWRINPSISGGGLFHDLAPHQLDLLYYFFGNYNYATGYAINLANKQKVSDTVNGIVCFKNGIQFRGLWSFDVPDYLEHDCCSIHGSIGKIEFPFYGNSLKLTLGDKVQTYNFKNPAHIQQPFIQETINYFLGKRTNPCSVDEGIIVTEIMDTLTKTLNI